MSDELNLLPCPFCRDEHVAMHPNDLADHGNQLSVPGSDVNYAHCDGCGAEGPQAFTEPEARDLWNRRASPAAAAGAVPVEALPPLDIPALARQAGFDVVCGDAINPPRTVGDMKWMLPKFAELVAAAAESNRAQQGEPVAWMNPDEGCSFDAFLWQREGKFNVPVYRCAAIKEAAPADAPQINQPVTHLELVMMSLRDAREVAMRNTVAARIPESGDFGRIAQNLDYAITAIESAEAARQAPVEDAREQQPAQLKRNTSKDAT